MENDSLELLTFDELSRLRGITDRSRRDAEEQAQKDREEITRIDDEICDRLGIWVGLRFGDVVKIPSLDTLFYVSKAEVIPDHEHDMVHGAMFVLVPVYGRLYRYVNSFYIDRDRQNDRLSISVNEAGIQQVACRPDSQFFKLGRVEDGKVILPEIKFELIQSEAKLGEPG